MRTQYNIITVKYGDKYSSEDVNRMYRMVEKNVSRPFTFYCMTDNSENLLSDINIVFLDESLDLESFWWKICLFDFPVNEKFIYFDLDIVIQNNIDQLFERIQRDKITIIDYQQSGCELYSSSNFLFNTFYNSSILGFYPKDHYDIYQTFMSESHLNIFKYRGLDRFLTHKFNDRLIPFDWTKDYYFRQLKKGEPEYNSYKVKLDTQPGSTAVSYYPEKTVCVISQARPELYKGLEKYFL